MAMQQRKRRRRSGGNNNNNAANPNKHYESNGPEVRIRGSAAQILEKYQQYARDAQTAGDRVKAEALYQHAEHYARIVAEVAKEQEKQRKEREARDAAKAEERAAREARSDNRDEEESGNTAGDQDRSKEDKSEDQPARPRASRSRKSADTSSDDTKADGDDAGKPRRSRRRTYEPKDASGEDDGVAKTIARGIEPAPAEGDA